LQRRSELDWNRFDYCDSSLQFEGKTCSYDCARLISALMFIGPCIILIVEQRKTNLMSLALLFHYLMLNMFRMLVQPFSGACDLFLELFRGLYCSGSMCVGVYVVVRLGWCGIWMQAEATDSQSIMSNA